MVLQNAFCLPFANGSCIRLGSYGSATALLSQFAEMLTLKEEVSQKPADIVVISEDDLPLPSGTDIPDDLHDEKEWEWHELTYVIVVNSRSRIGLFVILKQVFLPGTDDEKKFRDRIKYGRMGSLMDIVRYFAIQRGVLLAHGALIRKKNSAVILIGPGNIGKSTCCARIPQPWQPLSDDEAFIMRSGSGSYGGQPLPTWSRFLKNTHAAHGWDSCTPVPLDGIFFLRQSSTDGFERSTPSEAAIELYRSATHHRFILWKKVFGDLTELKSEIFHLSCDIARDVPSFVLHATREGKFWVSIDEALKTSGGSE